MVFFKVMYWELPDRNKWRHWVPNTNKLHYFVLPSQTGRPLELFFIRRVQSLATEGGRMEELKACLWEYRLPQREINGKSRVPKAAFDQTGWHSFGDIRRIHVESVCFYLWCTQWRHLYGSSRYCCSSAKAAWTHVYFTDVRHVVMACACADVGVLVGRWG